MRQQWRVWCCLAWVLWMAKTSGGVVTWVPVREFPERDLHDFTPQQYCAQPLEAFRVGHPAMAPHVQYLPMGVRPP